VQVMLTPQTQLPYAELRRKSRYARCIMTAIGRCRMTAEGDTLSRSYAITKVRGSIPRGRWSPCVVALTQQ
jgi:hypothetical protein